MTEANVELSMGDFFELQRGTTYKGSLKGLPGPVLLGLASIQRNGGFRQDKLMPYGGDSPENLLVRAGELFVSLKDVTQAGDLLGAVARVPPAVPVGRLTQDTVKLVPKSENTPLDYLYWLLRTPQVRSHCRSHATGTTNLGLARGDFLSISVPPLTTEREQTVALLQTIDDKIELNRQMNETLEEMTRALFKSWFVDFDPVRAKMEGRQPYGMDADTAALFPDSFEDSELGLIPKGWRVLPFEELFAVPLRNGLTRPKRVRGRGTLMVNMGELFSYRRIGDVPMARVPYSDKEAERSSLESGDLLFARQSLTREGAGQCSIVCEADEPRTFESHLIRCRLNSEVAHPLVYFHYFWSSTGRAQVSSIVTQVAAAGIRGSDLRKLPMFVPPRKEQRWFQELIGPLEERIVSSSAENRTLAALRDTLLPKLLSGEIRVPEAEEMVDAS